MLVRQALPAQSPGPIWSRAAIHDTVAAIARQSAYRRDVGGTLFSRIMQWISDMYSRLVDAAAGVPHGRVIATVTAGIVASLVIARIVYAARVRAVVAEVPNGGRLKATSMSDPWREAEQYAASGRFTEAAHSLYRATLVLLATRGLVRLHDSKTSGDYARELRRRGSPAHAVFRRFGARYDRVIYGSGKCSAADYAALLDDARGLLSVSDRAA